MLRQIVEGMKDLVKEANFDFNESGVQVQCMDSSNVGMVRLKMNEAAFAEYNCSEPLTLGLNVESLGKILKMCGTTDRVILMAGDPVPKDRLRFEFISEGDGRIANFEMPSMSIEVEPMGVADEEETLTVIMPSSEFKKAISDLKEFGDALRVQTTNDGITFNANGDIGEGNIILKPRDGGKPENTLTFKMPDGKTAGDNSIDQAFAMRYVNLFTRATGLSKTCEFALTSGNPFRLKYHLEEEHHGFIQFMLAPKMDE
jgi:proliferating cell nuclear antigen